MEAMRLTQLFEALDERRQQRRLMWELTKLRTIRRMSFTADPDLLREEEESRLGYEPTNPGDFEMF